MKAQAFLKLVGEMMTAQQDYFKSRRSRKGDDYGLLIKAKELERKVLAVVNDGRLEPDDISPEAGAAQHEDEVIQPSFGWEKLEGE